MITNAQVIV